MFSVEDGFGFSPLGGYRTRAERVVDGRGVYFRFWNNQVENDINGVICAMMMALNDGQIGNENLDWRGGLTPRSFASLQNLPLPTERLYAVHHGSDKRIS